MQYTERMAAIIEQETGMAPDIGALQKGEGSNEDPGMTLAMAKASEILAAFNAEENLKEQALRNDPATILALSEDRNSKTKAEELVHRKQKDYLDAVNNDRKLDIMEKTQLLKLAETASKNEMELNKTQLELGSKLVEQALAPMKETASRARTDKATP